MLEFGQDRLVISDRSGVVTFKCIQEGCVIDFERFAKLPEVVVEFFGGIIDVEKSACQIDLCIGACFDKT